MLEALLAMVLVVFAVGVMFNLSISAQDAQGYADRLARATELNERLINEIRAELLSSVDVTHASTVGAGYLAALQLDPTSPMLAGSRLPTNVIDGPFEREANAGDRTGNVLLAARQAWTTQLTCASSKTYQIDVYRLVCYYLTPEDGGPAPASPLGLNLTKFVSEPLIDAGQIDAVADMSDQQELLLHFANGTPDDQGQSYPRAVLVWVRGEDLSTTDALREIDPALGIQSSSPIAPRPAGGWTIARDDEHSQRGLLYYRHFSVASNYAHDRLGVAKFGVKDNSDGGFPHGFEIQIGGLSSSRQVLVHLSIVSTNDRGIRAHHDMRGITVVQDL